MNVQTTDITNLTDAQLDALLGVAEDLGCYNIRTGDTRGLTDEQVDAVWARSAENDHKFIKCDCCGARHKSGGVFLESGELKFIGNKCAMSY